MEDTQLISEKVTQAVHILRELDIDLWLTFVRETSMAPDPALELIFGGDLTWHSAFLITKTGEKIALVGQYDSANLLEMGVYSEVIGYNEGIRAPLLEQLNRLQPRTIAINYSERDVAADGLSHGMFRTLHNYLAGSGFEERLISAEQINFHLRGRKSPIEIARIRQAVQTTEKLFDEIENFVRPGMTQREISDFVHGRIDEMGLGYSWPKPFNPIVTCGPDSAVGHAVPGDVALQKGHLLHIDLGVRENGYASDLQRMWYVLNDGETEAPPDVQRAFMAVSGAIQTGEKFLRPGTPGWKVDEAAREFIVDHGYPEYMHAFGHMMGRVAHDGGTVLGPQWERYKGSCELEVEVGNVFTLELHVVVEGRGIMSLEEDVVVTKEGVVYLSTPQDSIRYLGVG
ncbi:MAG: Xaa-Pro peptidase family protein [Ardenticatenaceae bacterium]|nr:Xaa-Pro peptidase family protein [Ardenticatenaceae bacterium]